MPIIHDLDARKILEEIFSNNNKIEYRPKFTDKQRKCKPRYE